MSHRKTKITSAAALLVGLMLVGATAASAGDEAQERGQRRRIHQGVDDGSLTRREAHRLGREQARIERAEHRFRSNDDQLGPRERRRLHQMQDRASRHIYRGRHNDQTQ